MTKEAIMAADSIKSSAQIQVDQLTASGHEASAELVGAGNDHAAELIAEAETERTRAEVHYGSVSPPSAQIAGATTFTDFECFGDFEDLEDLEELMLPDETLSTIQVAADEDSHSKPLS